MGMMRVPLFRRGMLMIAAAMLAAAAQAGPAQDNENKEGLINPLIEAFSRIALDADHGTIFYGFDRLTQPGEPVDLTARVRWVRTMEEVPGVTVEFRQGKKVIGRAKTDGEGVARLGWKAPAPGDYEFTADIFAVPNPKYNEMLKAAPTPLVISAKPKDTRFVVIDLDHTVVAASFFRVLIGGAKPMPGSAKAVRQLNKKRDIIYLTHRPDVLMVKSRNWLKDNGFPTGTLIVSRASQAIGSSGKFKTTRIHSLRLMFPNIDIGIGDKISDAEAYVANGMTAYLIPHYDRDDPDDCREMAEKISKIDKNIQVVDNWQQILEGIRKGRKFPAHAYARQLRQRADRLEVEGRREHDEKHRLAGEGDDSGGRCGGQWGDVRTLARGAQQPDRAGAEGRTGL